MFSQLQSHTRTKSMKTSEKGNEKKILTEKKIVIVNPWDNKFTDLYVRYFKNDNEVQLIKPQHEKKLIQVLNWADLVWSQWANEWLVAISKMSFDATLVTHIHSFEILARDLIKNVLWERVDGIIFVADHIRENANRLWPQYVNNVSQTTIYNSVDLLEYPLRDVKSGKKIGYVGYINHKKGVELLLQCIKAAVALDKEYTLHIAGTFQETRFEVYMLHMLEEMELKDNVFFHGWVRNIPNWLKSINYIISTSPWEGCPMNLIEAMACGVKPLIHNWQGSKRLFPNKFIFNTIDEFIILLKNNSCDSKENRAIVETAFNAERNIPKIDKFLSDSISDRLNNNLSTISEDKKIDNLLNHADRRPKDTNIECNSVSNPKKQSINFYQRLASTIELSSNRKEFTVEFCRGKRVLHIGCVDAGLMDERIKGNNFLHYQIGKVAKKLIGADIDQDGLKLLSEEGFEVYKLDLENDFELLRKLSRKVDIIVIPEVIEHLKNMGQALDNIKSCGFSGDILISTPNAFSFRAYKILGNCIELVHPDHNCYFSPTTLKTALLKNGFIIKRLIMYYWKTNDSIGKELQKIVTECPYYGEGMIAIIKDQLYINEKKYKD